MSGWKKVVLPLIFILFAAYLVYSTLHIKRYTVEVCVEFEGRTACRTASGATREDAQRAAQDNACAQLTSGMTNTRICGSKPPVSVKWLETAE
ncbi:MAG: hypothetical protein Kow001_14100 [Acidobacteriota bacterium]